MRAPRQRRQPRLGSLLPAGQRSPGGRPPPLVSVSQLLSTDPALAIAMYSGWSAWLQPAAASSPFFGPFLRLQCMARVFNLGSQMGWLIDQGALVLAWPAVMPSGRASVVGMQTTTQRGA